MENLIGVDIGGTKIAVVYAQYQQQVCIKDKTVFETKTEKGPEYAIDKIISSIEDMKSRHELDAFSIGVSCGGPLDAKTGVILGPPNLPGWDRVPIVSILQETFCTAVYLQNDADACAIAEWKAGAGKGCESMIFLTFGTGLGAGLILGGRLYSGACGMAGEAGHIRLNEYGPAGYGKMGSFEGFCSGGGIAQLAQTMLRERQQAGKKPALLQAHRIEDITAKDVFISAENGDADAEEIVSVVGTQLGKGLAMLIDILNPERIVIGSIYARNHRKLYPYARAVIEKETLRKPAELCRILPAELGEQIGDYAAVLTAVYGMEEGNG